MPFYKQNAVLFLCRMGEHPLPSGLFFITGTSCLFHGLPRCSGLTGLIRIPGLDFEKRITMEKKPIHFLGTLIIGMAFGAGWSPCIGPLLGSILIIAGSQETVWQGILLLAIYSAGLALPFIVLSIFINFLLIFIKKASKALKYVNAIAGILLIIVGLILVSNKLYLFVS